MTDSNPVVRRVLAVTDLSPFGNAAVPHAYAIAPKGGVVRLLHIVETEPVPSPLYAHYSPGRQASPDEREAAIVRCREALMALEPASARERGVRTEVEIVEAEDVPAAILHAAQAARSDVICLGTHGRTGILGAVTGSVAKAVLDGSDRPLLLVRPR